MAGRKHLRISVTSPKMPRFFVPPPSQGLGRIGKTDLRSGLSKMKTFSAKPAEVKRDWFVVDAEGKALGRLASEVARRLRGKHKPEYTPHVDTGDYIVIINADKVGITGNKAKDKTYYHHTGHIGNMRAFTFEKMQQRAPGRVIELAVKGMLPKNPLGRAMYRKMKVYAGTEHNHQAQQPQALDF